MMKSALRNPGNQDQNSSNVVDRKSLRNRVVPISIPRRSVKFSKIDQVKVMSPVSENTATPQQVQESSTSVVTAMDLMQALNKKISSLEQQNVQLERDKARAMADKENFAASVQSELKCSICSEVFIQATITNCGHTFCALCISKWMKTCYACPVCREPVASTCRNVAAAGIVAAMYPFLPERQKRERREVVEERSRESVRGASLAPRTRTSQRIADRSR